MTHTDEATWQEWMDLDLDGGLETGQKARLATHLEKNAHLAEEHRCLGKLHALLEADRVEVCPDFTERVMERLPRASWEKAERRLPSWSLPVALVSIFGLAAAALLGGSLAQESQIFGILSTVYAFLQATTLAGAGLLFATWRGVGFGLQEFFAGSQLSLVAFGAFVIGLDLLFLSYLKRRRPAEVKVEAQSSD